LQIRKKDIGRLLYLTNFCFSISSHLLGSSISFCNVLRLLIQNEAKNELML
jgi:hypothetical protein